MLLRGSDASLHRHVVHLADTIVVRCSKRWRYTSIYNSVLESGEGFSLHFLRLLQLPEQFSLELLKIVTFSLQIRYVVLVLFGFVVDVGSGHLPLAHDKLIHLPVALVLLLLDLVLTLLGLHVGVSSLAVHAVLELLLHLAHLINSVLLHLGEVVPADHDHLLLAITSTLVELLVVLALHLSLLHLLHPLDDLFIVLLLQFLHLLRLGAGLSDLFVCSSDFLSEHPNSVPQLLDIPLQLETD